MTPDEQVDKRTTHPSNGWRGGHRAASQFDVKTELFAVATHAIVLLIHFPDSSCLCLCTESELAWRVPLPRWSLSGHLLPSLVVCPLDSLFYLLTCPIVTNCSLYPHNKKTRRRLRKFHCRCFREKGKEEGLIIITIRPLITGWWFFF